MRPGGAWTGGAGTGRVGRIGSPLRRTLFSGAIRMARRRAGYGEMVSKRAAAAYLGISIRHLDRLRKADRLQHEKVLSSDRFQGTVWFRMAHLNAYLRWRERRG